MISQSYSLGIKWEINLCQDCLERRPLPDHGDHEDRAKDGVCVEQECLRLLWHVVHDDLREAGESV